MTEVNCFCKKLELFLEDVDYECLNFSILKKVCDEIDAINITNFINSMKI